KIVEFSEKTHWLDTGFVFEIEEPKASCMGSLRAVRVAEDRWKLWTVYTVIFALDGVETLDEQKMKEKPIANGAPDGNFPEQTDILVIGAGQSGLCLSALLKSFQIPHVVVDGNQKCGDSWGTRYEACKLHTPKKIGHMPFLRYPENYPVFITAQQLSDHYESYRKSLGLPVYMQSRWEEGKWDEDRKEWTNKIKRKDGVKTIVAKHIVMCTGVGNTDPYEPEIPEREKFKGDIVHSVKYWNAEPWKGKRGLIIGAANSAHDIAMDMVRFGLSSVVLYQRNTSCMITCEEAIGKHYEHYNDFTPIEISDQMSESLPPSIGRILLNGWIKFSAEQNKEFYDSMKAKGMMI
ncbi:FAD/NAD(P)-binding domain-containing protein, partial [Atractiella rhizophila]